MPRNRLAILPDVTHYEMFATPRLAETVLPFLNGQSGARSWADQVKAQTASANPKHLSDPLSPRSGERAQGEGSPPSARRHCAISDGGPYSVSCQSA